MSTPAMAVPAVSVGRLWRQRAGLPEAASLAERFTSRVARALDDWLTWLYLARPLEMETSGTRDTAIKAEESVPASERPHQTHHQNPIERIRRTIRVSNHCPHRKGK